MIRKIYICDVCGKEVHRGDVYQYNKRWWFLTSPLWSQFDICKKCKTEIEDVIKERRK